MSLIKAIKLGDMEEAFSLLNQVVDVNQQDNCGYTALHFACLHAHFELVEALLNAGSNPNTQACHADNVFDEYEREGTFVWDTKVTAKIIKQLKDLGNRTPLHISVRDKNIQIVKLLLDRGAEPNSEDFGGCTPLHWAAINQDMEICQLLIANQAEVNVQDMAESTPLHEAIRKRNLELVQLLLNHGANPHLSDVSEQTAFDIVAGDVEVSNLLLSWSQVCPEGWITH